MTNEKINATVEEIMEYEALLDEVKGIVDGLKDNLKSQMDRSSYFQVQLQGIQKGLRKSLYRVSSSDTFKTFFNQCMKFFSLGSKNEPREESS